MDSKWITDLKQELENIGVNFPDFGLGDDFLDMISKVQMTKNVISWTTLKRKSSVV